MYYFFNSEIGGYNTTTEDDEDNYKDDNDSSQEVCQIKMQAIASSKKCANLMKNNKMMDANSKNVVHEGQISKSKVLLCILFFKIIKSFQIINLI